MQSYLSWGLDALEEAAEDDDPGDEQSDDELLPDAADLLDAVRNLEHVTAETSADTSLVCSISEKGIYKKRMQLAYFRIQHWDPETQAIT